MPKSLPFATSRLPEFISHQILKLCPKKSEIVPEAGFVNTNILNMIKSGKTKLPLDRFSGLAKALECDQKLLFKMALEQSGGETTFAAIEDIFGTIVTHNEVGWLNEIRDASGNTDPTLTSRARTAIHGIFGK